MGGARFIYTGVVADEQEASVRLLYQPDFLKLVIEDDGVGDQTGKLSEENAGMGLKNSSLRASYLGATLHCESGKAGTFIMLDIPYLSTAD